MSPGVRYCAVVSFNPSLSSSDLSPNGTGDGMSNSTCTDPLPNVPSPMTTARSRFFIAPATISLALAEFWFTSTATGTVGSCPLSDAVSSFRCEPPTPTIETSMPLLMNASATFWACSYNPPGLPRRSMMMPFTCSLSNMVRASPRSLALLAEKCCMWK